MASTSALLNRSLRRRVAPLLRESGFQQVDARNAWSWRGESIRVFQIRAVGSYFSGSTGWPPGSVCTWLGVFFTFTPQPPGLKHDEQGRSRPQEHLCHMRSHLTCGLDQSARVRVLPNPLERRRNDVWWVEPDGSNADEVADDVAASLVAQGLPWFERASSPRNALALVEATHDCFVKFALAALLARRIGDDERWQRYDGLAEAEARRIGRSLDRETWSGL
jgi:hypothetical protein